jgi:hypothetical protein
LSSLRSERRDELLNMSALNFVEFEVFQSRFDMTAVHRPISSEGLMPNRQITYGLLSELMEVQFLSVRWGKEVINQSVTHFGHDQT